MGVIEIRDLRVGFRRRAGLRRETVQALRGVDLAARPGEVLALAGESGGGKSLVLHAILGLLPPNARVSGELRLDGEQLRDAALARLRGRRLALVPQSVTHLDPLASVGHQIRWAARRMGGGGDVAGALRAVGLPASVAALRPAELSGGMARRVLLAGVLESPADVILADEPTDGLDPENTARVLGTLRGLADRGRTVLVATHDLASALPFADRVALIRDGQTLGTEDARDFTGTGARLRHEASRALWRALPENGFHAEALAHA